MVRGYLEQGDCDVNIRDDDWVCIIKGVYREEGMQLTMYPTYSSDFVSETGYAKNRIQYTDVNNVGWFAFDTASTSHTAAEN